jgi:hypothetical protein
VGVSQVRLFPGWNEVPDAQWDLCKLHIKDKLEAGKIEEMSRKDKDKDGNDIYIGVPISDIRSLTKVEEIIKGCLDIGCLEKWKKEDSRESMRIAYVNQIELCVAGGPKVEE